MGGGGGAFTAKGSEHPGGISVKGCRCCFPPDTMFEDACEKIVSLGLCTSINAQKYVRMCGGGSGSMKLSKKKAKNAAKLGKDGLLTEDQVRLRRFVALRYCYDAFLSVVDFAACTQSISIAQFSLQFQLQTMQACVDKAYAPMLGLIEMQVGGDEEVASQKGDN